MSNKNTNRFDTGVEKFKEINGQSAEASLERLKSLNPDLAKFVMEFSYGGIYSRPELDIKSREIATIAALSALGNAPKQLKVHIGCALNTGVKRQEITEIILQMAVYAGFPAAINAMQTVHEVFDELDKKESAEVTERKRELNGQRGARI
jgi:4-carboxymuconolactone decarboxylase